MKNFTKTPRNEYVGGVALKDEAIEFFMTLGLTELSKDTRKSIQKATWEEQREVEDILNDIDHMIEISGVRELPLKVLEKFEEMRLRRRVLKSRLNLIQALWEGEKLTHGTYNRHYNSGAYAIRSQWVKDLIGS